MGREYNLHLCSLESSQNLSLKDPNVKADNFPHPAAAEAVCGDILWTMTSEAPNWFQNIHPPWLQRETGPSGHQHTIMLYVT